MYKNAMVEIVEQPASTMRFRYLSEGPKACSLAGVNSTDRLRTYPSFRVVNYDGPVLVIVSCVTDDKIPKPHPNSLTGSNKGLRDGIYTTEFTNCSAAPTIVEFEKVGIHYIRKDLVKKYMDLREKQRIDPFKTGFGHNPDLIDMHRVRLCFQAFLKPDADNPKHYIPLRPVVSNVIVDTRSKSNLTIFEMSDAFSPARGGKLIMIFSDKVLKNDIGIKFYEKNADGEIVWEECVKPKTVHKQYGISLLTPQYRVPSIDRPVEVFLCLQTLSGEPTFGDPRKFQYVPYPMNIEQILNSKEQKIYDSILLYDFMKINEADNVQKSTMHRNILDNACTKNIAPGCENFGATNFDTSTNNFNSPHPLQPQQYDNVYPQRQQEQQYQPHNSDYKWRSFHPLQPLQPNNIEQQQASETPYYQQQYQRIGQTQNEMDTNYKTHTPRYNPYTRHTQVDNACGGTNNFSANDNIPNNFDRQSRTMGNCQPPVEPINHPCQQVGQAGPVPASDKVIIQVFSNNNITFNNQQSGAEILENLSDYCLSSDTSIDQALNKF